MELSLKPKPLSKFLPPKPQSIKPITISSKPSIISSSSLKIIRNPSLDNHIVKQNKIRFVQKLKTLLLSKPKHFLPIQILSKCRSYLSLPKPKSLLSMIHRYPSIFQLYYIPSSSPLSPNQLQLCVGLTPAAQSLAEQETRLQNAISSKLATKLQKLLMLSSHHRLLVDKLVHLAPDLGLPPNFRRRLCSDHPDRFRLVDTSYGRALELVAWDPQLAVPLPYRSAKPDLIVERPLKFKHLRLTKGVNVKRRHREFLIRFQESPEVGLYSEAVGEIGVRPESMEAEKRACGVVREVLGMMVEKRTLVDHLTHFRKEFGLSNKLRGMLVRHPELFYVSVKGNRDSVFLVEGYDERGGLVERDEVVEIKERLMGLVRESKRLRRERRSNGGVGVGGDDDGNGYDGYDDEEDDGFEDLFVEQEWEDYGVEDGEDGGMGLGSGVGDGEFWSIEDGEGGGRSLEHW